MFGAVIAVIAAAASVAAMLNTRRREEDEFTRRNRLREERRKALDPRSRPEYLAPHLRAGTSTGRFIPGRSQRPNARPSTQPTTRTSDDSLLTGIVIGSLLQERTAPAPEPCSTPCERPATEWSGGEGNFGGAGAGRSWEPDPIPSQSFDPAPTCDVTSVDTSSSADAGVCSVGGDN